MATAQETAQRLADIGTKIDAATAQLNKGIGEVQAEVQNLKDQLANAGGSTPEVDAALAALEGKVGTLATATQVLDDLNQDTPAPAPEQPAQG